MKNAKSKIMHYAFHLNVITNHCKARKYFRPLIITSNARRQYETCNPLKGGPTIKWNYFFIHPRKERHCKSLCG